RSPPHQLLTSFPTRRSSDLASTESVFPQITTPATMPETTQTQIAPITKAPAPPVAKPQPPPAAMQTSVQITFSFEIAAMQLTPRDRKSTRLNSSHQIISYAV